MHIVNLFIIPIILTSLFLKLRFAYIVSLMFSLVAATFIFANVSMPNILFTIAVLNLIPFLCRIFSLKQQARRLSLEKKSSAAGAAYDRLCQEHSLIEQSISKLNDDVSGIAELYRITRNMSEVLEFAEIFEILGKKLTQSFQFQRTRLILIDEEAGLSEIRKVWELKYGSSQASLAEPEAADSQMLKQSARTQKASYIEQPPAVFAPLLVEGKLLGTLLVEGMSAKWLDSFSILTNQFSLEFRRIVLYQKVQELAITDGLSGLYVHRYFLERLQEELKRSIRHNLRLAFLMVDIDYFKQCNDKYGHLAGDVVLSEVARIIRANVRQIDLVGRYGGEEFCVLLPDTDKPGGGQVAERMRANIDKHQFHAYDEAIKTTVSIGVAVFPDDARGAQSLIDRADQALYRAKQAGRNRVEFF